MTKETLKRIKLYRPVDAHYPISSQFGVRKDPLGKDKYSFHNGIDFAVPIGSKVYAGLPGKVFKSGWENEDDHNQGFGLRVWQECDYCGEKYFIWYAHLSKTNVEEGAAVFKGQVIGWSGNTGRSTGPHLHIQIRKRDTSKYYDMEFEEG